MGFTIVTDRPFAEVFVASSPELFQPENASRRTPSNWFASRAHGLIQGPGELAYMLPAAFVASAVKAEPRATRLFYVAAAYTTADATDPVWSMPADGRGTSLPYVEIAPDLHAPAIASTLGVALDRLSRTIGWNADVHGSDALGPAFGASSGAAFAAAPNAGEPRVLWRHETTGTIGAALIAQGLEVVADERDGEQEHEREGGHEDEYDGEHDIQASVRGNGHGNGNGHGSGNGASYARVAYDDGHGPLGSAARGLDSTYPAGAEEPDELPDDEGDYGDEASWQAAAAAGGAPSTPAPSDAAVARAFDRVLDELARTRNGSLYDVARPTQEDGLAFGLLQATQRSGELGRVLDRLRASDAATFAQIFGPSAGELLAVTTADVETERMRSVGGKPLGDDDWRRRFAQAGRHESFVVAQRAYARQRMLEPLLPIARDLGLASPRGMAVLACVLVGKGLEPGMQWILGGISPVATAAQVTRALQALGHADLPAFQTANALRASGQLDVATTARITRKLRELQARSPVPVLEPSQMIQTLARQASGEAFQAKLESLVASAELDGGDI